MTGAAKCGIGLPDPSHGRAAMTLKTRIIPCLDVKDGRVVKGVQFVGLRDAGDPVQHPRPGLAA